MKISNVTWPDNLRVIATISVVLLHVTSPILLRYGKVPEEVWNAGNVVDSAVRFCVPVFVMLSGALLLPRQYPVRVFLKKRLTRVLLPFVFYTAVYILYDLYHKRLPVSQSRLAYVWDKLAHGASYHLWYVYMILGLYLFIPVIGRWIRASSEKEISYFLGLWVLTMALSHPFIQRHIPNVDLSYFSGFLGYLVLGYYLSLKKAAGGWKTSYSITLLVLGIAITVAGTFLHSADEGKYVGIFYGFLTPNVLLSSAGLFMLVGDFKFSWAVPEAVRAFLCRYSYGIYLVHVLVLTELNKAGLNCFYIHPAIGITLSAFCCLAVSALITYFISKVPLGRYICG